MSGQNEQKIRRLVPNFLQKYLPIVARNHAGAPDSVRITLSTNKLQAPAT